MEFSQIVKFLLAIARQRWNDETEMFWSPIWYTKL